MPVDHPFKAPIQEPAPVTLIRGGFWGNSLLSEILTNRYLYALPFYRQSQMFAQRFDVELARSSMSDCAENVAKALEPVYEAMKQELLVSGYVGCDETPVKFLAKHVGCKQGYFWVYRNRNKEVLFDWKVDRVHSNLEDFLGPDFKGVIQSDGYEAYKTYCEANEERKRAACLAHIRRKFEEALKGRPKIAKWFLKIHCPTLPNRAIIERP